MSLLDDIKTDDVYFGDNKSRNINFDDINFGNSKSESESDADAKADADAEAKADAESDADSKSEAFGVGAGVGVGLAGSLSLGFNENKNENDNDNDNDNKNTNVNENKVDVDVDVDLGLDGWDPKDNDTFDLDWEDAKIDAPVLLAEDGDVNYSPGDDITIVGGGHKVDDDGNAFSVGQVNSLVDNDIARDINFHPAGGAGFSATAYGGDKIEVGDGVDMDGKVDDDIGDDIGGSASVSADATATIYAQNLEIVLGANIQYNLNDMTIAGNNITSSVSTNGEDGDDAFGGA